MKIKLLISYRIFVFLFVLLIGINTSTGQQNNPENNQSISFSFVFITDMHLDHNNGTLQYFDNAVKTVNNLNPDFIITGGDNVKDATHVRESNADSLYNLYISKIEEFNVPVNSGIGNHEVFGVNNPNIDLENPLYGKKMYESKIGDRYYTFSHKGWKFFMIDNIMNTDSRHKYIGCVDDEQMEWLKNELAETDSLTPIVICSHIPFISSMKKFELGSLSGNPINDGVSNSIEFFKLFSNHNLKLLLQGHFHFFEVLYANDIYYITGPSLTGLHGGLTRKSGLIFFTTKGDNLTWKFVENEQTQIQTQNTSTVVEQLLPNNLDAPDKIWEQIDEIPIMLPLSKYSENINLRKKLVSKLDEHMTYYKYHVYSPGSDDKSYGNRDGSNNAQETPFTTAYRKRVQKVIDEIDLLQPKEDELIIWKLYSSGYIFKSPKYVFAVDISEGPTIDNKKLQEERGKAFCMTAKQVSLLAGKVDFAFFSHNHIDHISYPFVSMMIKNGHQIYGPNNPSYFYTEDLVEYYGLGSYSAEVAKINDPWISDTTCYSAGDGDFKFIILNGYQDWKDQENGTPTNFSYLLETDNGINLIYFGDQRTSANHKNYPNDISCEWLRNLNRMGYKIDIKVGSGPLMHKKNEEKADQVLRELFKPIVRIPGHEWEITHPSFSKYHNFWSTYPEAVEQTFPLTIGEHFRFIPKNLNNHRYELN